jgi:hypothetical protein
MEEALGMYFFTAKSCFLLNITVFFKRVLTNSMQACTDVSPHEGPFKKDAPAWCASPFEPEGLLRWWFCHRSRRDFLCTFDCWDSFFCEICSSFSAVLSTVIGVHYGHVLVHMKVILPQSSAALIWWWEQRLEPHLDMSFCSWNFRVTWTG